MTSVTLVQGSSKRFQAHLANTLLGSWAGKLAPERLVDGTKVSDASFLARKLSMTTKLTGFSYEVPGEWGPTNWSIQHVWSRRGGTHRCWSRRAGSAGARDARGSRGATRGSSPVSVLFALAN
eukprot:GHVT01102979.1.p2 GENE.GHVT01102979.1~~GHVT01102979.1.p2  ORF type:complete len:123 (-),score=6.19 GHVT01102979.1:803-1171(-)